MAFNMAPSRPQKGRTIGSHGIADPYCKGGENVLIGSDTVVTVAGPVRGDATFTDPKDWCDPTSQPLWQATLVLRDLGLRITVGAKDSDLFGQDILRLGGGLRNRAAAPNCSRRSSQQSTCTFGPQRGC